jgi:hypothetical protein
VLDRVINRSERPRVFVSQIEHVLEQRSNQLKMLL